jgi:O-antigen/teichoic acid export membrane protein
MDSAHTRSALRLRSFSAWRWGSFGEVLSRAISPITLIVVTRLLSPSEYGLYVGALIVVALGQVVVESGVSRALVQKKGDMGDIQRVASSAFVLVLLVGFALSALLWTLSYPISRWIIGDSAGQAVLGAMSLQIPIAAAGAIHRAILERELRFRRIFAARVVLVSVTAAVTISLAATGFGQWSLVVGALSGISCEVAVLWLGSGFRPQLRLSRTDLASVATFSAWALGQDILAWVAIYADALLVAAVLELDQLAKYRMGTIIVTSGFAALFVPADKVLFSTYSKYPDANAVGRSLCYLMLIGGLVAVPMGLILFAAHGELEALVFPASWAGIGFVVGIVALREALANSVFAADPAYKGVGRPDIIFKLRVVTLMMMLGLQALALPLGFEWFLIARVAGSVAAVVVIVVVANRFFGRCHLDWTRNARLAVVFLVLIAALAMAQAAFPAGRTLLLIAFALMLIPFGFVALRTVRSILTHHL